MYFLEEIFLSEIIKVVFTKHSHYAIFINDQQLLVN